MAKDRRWFLKSAVSMLPSLLFLKRDSIFASESSKKSGENNVYLPVVGSACSMVFLREYLGDNTSGVAEFDNIPQNLRHLRMVATVRSSAPDSISALSIQLNGVTDNFYDYLHFGGQASFNPAVEKFVNKPNIALGYASGRIAVHSSPLTIDFPAYNLMDYNGVYNVVLQSRLSTWFGIHPSAGDFCNVEGMLSNPYPLSRISLALSAGNFDVGTRITLYGMA